MKRYIGVWVDHRKAYVVRLLRPDQEYEKGLEKETIKQITSDIDRRTRLSGGSRTGKTPWGPQEVAVDSKIEDRQKHRLKNYYDKIIEKLKDADKILIMGPGEAKHELRKQIDKTMNNLKGRIVDLETRDKMTERQIAAHVRLVLDPRKK
ncbi:MAG: hypothetical protein AMJ54_00330 [Deltaproteobacteria bacterium SG8_13]|nr:MAG: hypothetical protein AMJ54_00330 [Deltaproteobacteria bacterium SG8_13]